VSAVTEQIEFARGAVVVVVDVVVVVVVDDVVVDDVLVGDEVGGV
jgi:hypothetical protein